MGFQKNDMINSVNAEEKVSTESPEKENEDNKVVVTENLPITSENTEVINF